MKVDGKAFRSIWDDDGTVHIIDQRWLPHDFRIEVMDGVDEFAVAIRDMWVRGAPLIGATAAYGMSPKLQRLTPLTAPLNARPIRLALPDQRRSTFNGHWIGAWASLPNYQTKTARLRP